MTKKNKRRPRLSKAGHAVADARYERTLEPLDAMDDKINVGPGVTLAQRTAAVADSASVGVGQQVQEVPATGGGAINPEVQHARALSTDLHAKSGHPTLAERVQREGVRAQYGLGSAPESEAATSPGDELKTDSGKPMSKRKKRRRRRGGQ